MKQSHRNGFNRAGKFIFRLKVPLQYPMRYTILIRRHLKLLMTDRKTSWLYGVTLNLNIMAHFQKNRKKKNNESRKDVLHDKKSYHLKVRISFTVVVLLCICSHSNNLEIVRHQNYLVIPQKPEAQVSKQPNKTSLARFSTF